MATMTLSDYDRKTRMNKFLQKKMNGNDKSQLFNNKMFAKLIDEMKNNNQDMQNKIKNLVGINDEHKNDIFKNVCKIMTQTFNNKISHNNKLSDLAKKANGIINDLNDVVDNSSPIINTPEHPFTKMNIERHLMIGTSIQPDNYEALPIVTIDDNNVGHCVWSDRINISGFIDNNITEIYNLVISNNICEYQTHQDGTVEVNLYELKYEHINGNVTFVRSMLIDPNNSVMTLIKTWNIEC